MKRRKFIAFFAAATAAWPLGARAQQAEKVYEIASLTAGSPGPSIVGEAFRELGYVGGKNVTFESRYAEDRLDRLPKLAAELVSLNVDVIIALGTLAPLAAKQATSTIVMIAAGDPVGSGLVASLAHPGGNVTGTSLMAPDLGGKRLELLKEFLPGVSRVAVVWNAANPYSALVFKETAGAARTFEVELQSLEVRKPADIDAALEAAMSQHADALITVADPLTVDLRKQIAEFAANHTDCRQYQASDCLRIQDFS
jgi:putative tryptophan/tyrosine transport system substrate-binding protein